MSTGLMKIPVLLVSGVLYWLFVCWVTGAAEPWDADAYWRLWYPASLGLAALTGAAFKTRGWMAGVILTFAQLPVIWLTAGTISLWVIGLAMCCVLAVPAVAISAFTGWFAARSRPL